jgi:hypothetical protein
MRSEAKVSLFEAGTAFLLAMFVCAIAGAIEHAMIGRPLPKPSGYWFWAWIIVFFILWSMRQWFMPNQWDGRDLKGTNWRRFSAFLALFVTTDLTLWFLG